MPPSTSHRRGEPQRGVLPSRCLSGALTFLTHIPESICGQKESTFLRTVGKTQIDQELPVIFASQQITVTH